MGKGDDFEKVVETFVNNFLWKRESM